MSLDLTKLKKRLIEWDVKQKQWVKDTLKNSQTDPVACYKIVNYVIPDEYEILFHGINGTRKIPLDTWLKADRKWAGEGGQKYWTGFHVFLTEYIAEKYLERFTDKKKTRVVVHCYAKGIRPKESSRGNVFLAKELMVPAYFIKELKDREGDNR